MAQVFRQFTVLEGTGLPTHRPALLGLDVREYGQRVYRVNKPAAFEVDEAWLWAWASQLAYGIRDMHARAVAHLDLVSDWVAV